MNFMLNLTINWTKYQITNQFKLKLIRMGWFCDANRWLIWTTTVEITKWITWLGWNLLSAVEVTLKMIHYSNLYVLCSSVYENWVYIYLKMVHIVLKYYSWIETDASSEFNCQVCCIQSVFLVSKYLSEIVLQRRVSVLNLYKYYPWLYQILFSA